MEHSSSLTKTPDSVNYETSYGHCRCCLEEGQHRDITRVYHPIGEKEVYADIFLDCFNVFLSTNTNLSTLICSPCVGRLRDARDFKALVLRTEEQLMAALQDSYGDRMVLINVPIPKETLDTTIGFKIKVHNDHEEPKQPPTVHNTHTEEVPVIEQTEEELPLREDTKKEKCKMRMEKDELEPDESGPVAGSDSDSESGNPESPSNLRMRKESDPKKKEKMALIANTYTVLSNCNATLFKSKKQDGFPCFYCKEIFNNFDLLRQHQTQEHKKNDLLKSLKTYSFEGLVVYADVTELKCDLCDHLMPNLKEFKSHLIEYHEKKFFPKITDRILPFKLFENYFECQFCPVNYETFGAIERHMNTHFRNYLCKVCGGGFVTIMRLKTHYHSLHKEGTYPCEYCDKNFKTQLRHKVHVDFVHKMLKKLKCYQCSERFSDYFVRKKHMVEVHGELPIVYRCNVCSKEFNRRYTLSCHMKRHLQLKDVECDLCTYTCYNKTELREHMLKHNKRNMDRTFLCTICDKTYSRKKTLREHMRIHMDDRRYTCLVCDQTFVQRTGLVSHIKNHHKDYASEYEMK